MGWNFLELTDIEGYFVLESTSEAEHYLNMYRYWVDTDTGGYYKYFCNIRKTTSKNITDTMLWEITKRKETPITKKIEIKGSCYYKFSTKAWPAWSIYMKNTYWAPIKGYGSDPNAEGYWLITPLAGGWAYNISPKRWKDWYIYMSDSWSGSTYGVEKGTLAEDDRLQEDWVLKENQDGSFLVSCKKWPTWNIYMTATVWANVNGYNGDPGPQGH